MKMRMRDSRGRESTTLAFVAASWAAVTVVFVFVGIKTADASSIQDYGVAVMAILAPWIAREFQARPKNGAPPDPATE